ncbi:MAG: fumarylacetoacetate hydrolase family protein, partial [Sphingomonadaceae bacterium]|nr:fumarylacetoacetate hydrolase family protein [Sphingomonadaceae bacterium]
MKLVKVEREGETGEGLLDGDIVHIVGGWRVGAAADAPFSLSKRSTRELDGLRASAGESVLLSSVRLAVPIDPRAKILCVGMNYRDHVGEIKLEVAPNPTIFTRFHDTLVPDGAELVRTRISETYDFEGEIAIVIGRDARHVRVEDAMYHVGGYT